MAGKMTLTQEIISEHLLTADGKRAEKRLLHENELVFVKPDLALANDITGPVSINELKVNGLEKISDDVVAVFVADHFTPNKDIKAAENTKTVREFAKKHGLDYLDDGIEHVILPEKGYIKPHMLCVGADSHTCTYGALNAFSAGYGSTDVAYAMATGKFWLKVPPAIAVVFRNKLNKYVSGKDIVLSLIGKIGVSGASYKSIEFYNAGEISMDSRFTIANMVTEAGAKNGLFQYDEVAKEYLKDKKFKIPGDFNRDNAKDFPDSDIPYEKIIEMDLSEITPVVAVPNLPENVKPVSECGDIRVDQVVIGSCTNGRISDLAQAAEILKGKKVAPGVRTIIIPGSNAVFLEAVRKGYIETFIEAGATVSAPTCGPCLGGHMGVLASGEKALSTTNRNFTGRMGAKTSEVYLSSPAVAAFTAIEGRICCEGY